MELTAVRLKDLLEERSMSAKELAEKSGLSQAAISHYLSGRYKPGNITAVKIAKVFNVNPMWIMGFNVQRDVESAMFVNKKVDYYVDDLNLIVERLDEPNRENLKKYAEFLFSTQKKQ